MNAGKAAVSSIALESASDVRMHSIILVLVRRAMYSQASATQPIPVRYSSLNRNLSILPPWLERRVAVEKPSFLMASEGGVTISVLSRTSTC
jgi:hypothetical protein